MSAAPTLQVSVAWATPRGQDVVPVAVPAGATVAEAIAASGVVAAWGPEAAAARPAIRGRPVGADALVAEGDRIDLTRPLTVDPKEARRLRAAGRGRARSGPGPGVAG